MHSPILTQIVPATIMTSHCRGLARKTPDPIRSISNFEAPVAIISIAQQERPNVKGQIEELSAQLKSSSVLAIIISPPPENCCMYFSPENLSIFWFTAIRGLLSSKHKSIQGPRRE